jgi:hypothetical protein
MSSSSSSPFDSEDESESNMAKYNPFSGGRWSLCRVGRDSVLSQLAASDPRRIGGTAMLELDGNDLVDVPEQVLMGLKLTELCLNANAISVLPAGMGSMRKLESLWLHDNRLTLPGLVKGQLWNLKRLSCLILTGNDQLPQELAIETNGLEETQALLQEIHKLA